MPLSLKEFSYSGHTSVTSFKQIIAQTTPTNSSVAVRVWAVDADEDNNYGITPGSGAESGETLVNI